jgi:hypothetical protein
MLLLYSDTAVSSNCYKLSCSMNKDKSVSVTTSGNYNQQILEQNCAQESASECHITEDEIPCKTSVTTSSLASWCLFHNFTHPLQLFSFWILSRYWRNPCDVTTIPDHSELCSDTSEFWTDCLCICKVETGRKNETILVCHTCIYVNKEELSGQWQESVIVCTYGKCTKPGLVQMRCRN